MSWILATQQLTRITDDPGIDTEPQWSKDGQSLYFTSDRAGGPQIYKVGLKPGDKPRRLTFQGSYNARPRVSPDESQLAFVTQEDGAYRIATMDLRGHGDVQVLTKGRFRRVAELRAERRGAHLCEPRSGPRRPGPGQRRRTSPATSGLERGRTARAGVGAVLTQSQTKYTNRLIAGTLTTIGPT